ncbi:MAG: amidase [Variovorax sp.]
MTSDLTDTRDRLRSGGSTALHEIERAIEIAASPACDHAFTHTLFDSARQQAAAASSTPSLAGLAVSIKDLFDIEGQPTHAGSRVLANAPAAPSDAVAVARLRRAGAAFIGRTQMTEFAFSGVGINPHDGTPANPCDSVVQRIPGGSTSGGAVSVATGAAFLALGSDTGGSLRIPAALTGVVGFKSTARLVPKQGALPLSTTLDTVGAITRSVRDAVLAHELLSERCVAPATVPLAACRLAVVEHTFLDALEPDVARAFEDSLRALRAAGASVETVAMPELAEVARLNEGGGFSAAESYAWHRLLLERQQLEYDPRVAVRILRGAGMSAWQYLDLQRLRCAFIERVEQKLAVFDAVLSPTVPITAPPLADIAPGSERDEAFFRVNALLLRNPSIINLLDGCAISLPCHAPGALPVGLMLWHGAMHDDALLGLAAQVEAALGSGGCR